MTLEIDIRLRLGDFRLEAGFSLPAGITALFGPSGSGKSTLLAVIAGLTPAEGPVALDGQDVRRLPAHCRGIGLVFQDARLFPHLSVRGNLRYAQRRARQPRDLKEVASFFDITALLDRPVTNLSGGEKSRVALARALVAAPGLLLLDEPFAALDGMRRSAFISILLEAQSAFGFSMLVVTHDITEACALAGHVVALKYGRIVAAGPFAETVRRPVFQALLDWRDIGAAVPSARLVTGHAPAQGALWLRADQVLVASERPSAISARNILESRVTAITAEAGGSRLVELDTAAGPILSRLTVQAMESLSLAPGSKAWAVFKAHAV